MRSRPLVVTALGIAQILAWGSSFYFPAVLAEPIVSDTGWSLGWVVGGVSIGLLVAGLIAPRVGAIIERRGGRPVLAASSLLYAAGLAGIGLAPTLPVYLAAWVVLGAGMQPATSPITCSSATPPAARTRAPTSSGLPGPSRK